ncbi:MAG: WG repeat-containing protein, partial [Muribaculaceae bacterium]|nr:WG repeat-containing protein [Muribaculaceae bacterium]
MTNTNIIKALFIGLLTVSNVCKAQEVNDSIQGSDGATLYDWAFVGSNGLIYVANHGPESIYDLKNFAIIDRTGKVLIDGENSWVEIDYDLEAGYGFFSDQQYQAFGEKGKGYGIMDNSLNIMIPAQFSEIKVTGDYAATKVSSDSDWQIMYIPDANVVGTVPGKYNIDDISEGTVLAYTEEEPFVYLDFRGEVIIPYSALQEFYIVCGFRDGLALVLDQNANEGYIDKEGTIVIPCSYYLIESLTNAKDSYFKNGVALVESATNGCGAIDKAGKQIIPFGKYSSLTHLPNGNIGAFNYDTEDVLRYTEFD